MNDLTREQLKCVLIASRYARRPRDGLQYNIFTNVHPKSVSRQLCEARKTYNTWVSEGVLPVQAALVLHRDFRAVLDALPALERVVACVLKKESPECRESVRSKRLVEDDGEDGDDDEDDEDVEVILRHRKRPKRLRGEAPIGVSENETTEGEDQGNSATGQSCSYAPEVECDDEGRSSHSSGYASQPDVDMILDMVQAGKEKDVGEWLNSILDDATKEYIASCKPNPDANPEFEDIFRHYLSKSRGAQKYVTMLFKALKKFRPVIDYDKLPATGPTVMKKKKKDLKGAKIFPIYVDFTSSNAKRGKRKEPKKNKLDEPDDVVVADIDEVDEEEGVRCSDSEDELFCPRRPDETSRNVAGKYVHFGLEKGIFGESIGMKRWPFSY